MSYLGASLSSRERVTVGSAVFREHIHRCHRICASDSSNPVILSRISTSIGVTWSTQTWHSSFICSMTSCTWRASALLQCSVVASVLQHGVAVIWLPGLVAHLLLLASGGIQCVALCCSGMATWWFCRTSERYSQNPALNSFYIVNLSSKLSGFWECSTCCVRRAPYNGHVSLVHLLWLWASAYIYIHQYIDTCI